MKKFKIILAVITIVFSIGLVTACSQKEELKENENEKVEEKTIAGILKNQFEKEIKTESDLEKIAHNIAKNEALKIEMDVTRISKNDYLSGFKTEIKGFNESIAIKPMISTIPFLAYIFEVKDAEEFANNLKENADLRWNICTEADNLEVSVVDNYVFFVMAPKSFDEE